MTDIKIININGVHEELIADLLLQCFSKEILMRAVNYTPSALKDLWGAAARSAVQPSYLNNSFVAIDTESSNIVGCLIAHDIFGDNVSSFDENDPIDRLLSHVLTAFKNHLYNNFPSEIPLFEKKTSSRYVKISYVCVSESHWRKGIAEKLVRAILHRQKSENWKYLYAENSGPGTQNLCGKLGFGEWGKFDYEAHKRDYDEYLAQPSTSSSLVFEPPKDSVEEFLLLQVRCLDH